MCPSGKSKDSFFNQSAVHRWDKVNDPGVAANSRLSFHYGLHGPPEHYTIMHKWILSWILPTLLYRSCFLGVCLVGTLALACNDMAPEQMATNANCSSPERHTRSYDYMEGGDIRVRRLFCRTQWYLRIDKRGKVKGTQEMKNSYSKYGFFLKASNSLL